MAAGGGEGTTHARDVEGAREVSAATGSTVDELESSGRAEGGGDGARRDIAGAAARGRGRGCLPWVVVTSALVLFASWLVLGGERGRSMDAGPRPREPATREAPPASASDTEFGSADLGGRDVGSGGGLAHESGARPPVEIRDAPPGEVGSATDDVRAVPEGTPEEHARAFLKLPVAVSDGPPIGQIGETGIHLDDLDLGTGWTQSRCTGVTERFSVGAGDPVNLCIRAVHPRIEEEVMVSWQKEGVTVRRRKVTIRSLHAYRTRAYLALRPEYVGNWSVKVVAADGAELGSASFQVSE